jgi:hypothetical protein
MHYPQFSSIVANAFKEVYQSSPRCLPLQIFTYSTISLNFHNHVASSNFSLRKLSRFSSIDVIPQKQGPFFHPYMSFLKKKFELFLSINASSPRKLKEMLSRDGPKIHRRKLVDFSSLAKKSIGFTILKVKIIFLGSFWVGNCKWTTFHSLVRPMMGHVYV